MRPQPGTLVLIRYGNFGDARQLAIVARYPRTKVGEPRLFVQAWYDKKGGRWGKEKSVSVRDVVEVAPDEPRTRRARDAAPEGLR